MFRSGFARCPLDGHPLQEIAEDPLEGSTFADRYVIEQCIGEGGMGRVYRARHQRVSRQFAIKVLYGEHAAEEKMRERFAREAEAACRLSHPNVISVLDYGETKTRLSYLVMDWVEGRELRSIIAEQAPLDANRVIDLTRQLCAGLAHAHEKGLIHRDFKGENVLITVDDRREVPRIVDFGIAVLLEAPETGRLTTEGIVVGTPAYMSPEQATCQELDARTDLFSLGVLMYEMLAGVLPFEGPPVAIARQNLSIDPPAIRTRVPGLEVSAALEAISLKLMSKRPKDRYPSANAVIEALDALGDNPAITAMPARVSIAPPPSDEIPALQPARKRAWAITLAALLLLGGVTGISVVALTGGDGKTAAAAMDAGAVAMGAIDAGPPVPTAADASPLAALAVADAAGQQPDARVRVGRRPKDRVVAPDKPGKPDAAPAVAVAVPPDKPISQGDLQTLYVAVGNSIDTLATKRGTDAARAFRDEYFRIPFADALRTPALRTEVASKLRSLRRRVDKALGT